MSRTQKWYASSAAFLLIGLLAFAPTAAATVIEGNGLVVGKDMTTRQLTLLSGLVLQVTETTRLISKAGRRITLAQIVVAPSENGVTRMLPEAMVRYQARKSRTGASAVMVRVTEMIPH